MDRCMPVTEAMAQRLTSTLDGKKFHVQPFKTPPTPFFSTKIRLVPCEMSPVGCMSLATSMATVPCQIT